MQRILRQLKCIYSIYSNSHQFAYRDNRSTEDAKATEPHNPDPFLIGFSSEFSTIISNRLATKLGLSLPHSICLWILEQPPRVSQGPIFHKHSPSKHALHRDVCYTHGCTQTQSRHWSWLGSWRGETSLCTRGGKMAIRVQRWQLSTLRKRKK